MLQYKITINGETIKDISIGAKFIEKLEEAMDTAQLQLKFTNRPTEFQMYDLLQVTIKDDDEDETTFDFLINGDRVEEGSKYGEYIHNLDFIEYSYKYNMYLVHTLTKTKTIKSSLSAPFEVSDLNTNKRYFWIPPIEIVESYYTNEDIVIPQVQQGYQSLVEIDAYSTTFDRVDVYVQIVGEPSTRQILSNGDATFNISTAGDYEIEYGFVVSNYDNDFFLTKGADQYLYRFRIRVIEREEFSILDLLNLVRTNVSVGGGIESKLYFDDTRLFDIDPDIQDYLASVEAPQIFVQKATLRQVLNSILLYVNAISRVKWNSEEIDELTVDWFNKIDGSFTMKNIAQYGTSQTANQLASKGVSFSQRALPDNRERANLKLASQNQFITVRSSNIQIVNGKFGLELNGKELYEPKKLVVPINDVKFSAYDGVDTYVKTLYDTLQLDLTPRFINIKEWSIKDYTNNFPDTTTIGMWGVYTNTAENKTTYIGLRENKVGNIAWTQGSTYIDFGEVYGEVFQEALIMNVIAEALNEHLTRYAPEPILKGTSIMLVVYNYRVAGYKNGSYLTDLTDVKELDYEYLKFGLDYITQQNTTLEAERADSEFMPYYAEAKMNQNDKITNVELASRRLYGVLQRSGVPTKSFVKYHEKLSDMYPLAVMDSDNNVITQRAIEAYNNYIKATYITTKYHNRSSLWAGLQQEYRVFENPTSNQIYERIEAYTDYILISKPDNDISDDNIITKIYSNKTLELMFGILTNNETLKTGNTKVTHAYVITDGFLTQDFEDSNTYDYAISTPVNSFGSKGELTFEFGFINNIIAANGVYTNDNNLRYNKAVKYTDDYGRFNQLWFQLNTIYDNPDTADGWTEIERLDNYPLVRTDNNSFGTTNTIMYQSGSQDFDSITNDNLIITKDSSQGILIDYKNRFRVLDELHYIIGQAFYSNNFLVYNDFSDSLYIYIYSSKKEYYLFDDLRVKSGWTYRVILVNGVNCEWDSTNNTFRFLGTLATTISENENWAIGDLSEELYWACNYNHNGFDVFKTHFRADLREIGNREFPSTSLTAMTGSLNAELSIGSSFIDLSEVITQSFERTLEITSTLERGTDIVGDFVAKLNISTMFSQSDVVTQSFSKTLEISGNLDRGSDNDVMLESIMSLQYQFVQSLVEPQSFEKHLELGAETNSEYFTGIAPTITLVSKSYDRVTYNVKNNDNIKVYVYSDVNDTTPNANARQLDPGKTSSNITITGLTQNTQYTIYARSYYNDYFSNNSGLIFKTDMDYAENPNIIFSCESSGTGGIKVKNNDTLQARIYYGTNQSAVASKSSSFVILNGGETSSLLATFTTSQTFYAMAVISGLEDSDVINRTFNPLICV